MEFESMTASEQQSDTVELDLLIREVHYERKKIKLARKNGSKL
jgi:hypothetical protein